MRVDRTEAFIGWLRGLRDKETRGRIARRIERLADGNPGDAEGVGQGVTEMRLHFGPGYRVYYVQRGPDYAIVLWGGDKSTQASDIETAKDMARRL